MKILVSFCNQQEPDDGLPTVVLAIVDDQTLRAEPYSLSDQRLPKIFGVTGLAHFGDGLLLVTQSDPNCLVYLTRQLQIQQVWPLSSVRNGHSLSIHEGKIYIASTGTDAIVAFDPGHGESVYWRASPDGGHTVHLNSVLWHCGELYATSFGPKPGDLWRTAQDGRLVNIGSGKVVLSPLYHPHSAVAGPGNSQIYCCESWHQAVWREDGQRLYVGTGYTRGLALTTTDLYVGVSTGRSKSKSTGVSVLNLDQPEWTESMCGVMVYELAAGGGLLESRLKKTIDLEQYSREIYDLLLLKGFRFGSDSPQWPENSRFSLHPV